MATCSHLVQLTTIDVCMKQPFFMLSLLIPSPNAPGNGIDVYLQPLIGE